MVAHQIWFHDMQARNVSASLNEQILKWFKNACFSRALFAKDEKHFSYALTVHHLCFVL